MVGIAPDDITLDEFMFDWKHPTRASPKGMPWFIDAEDSGRVIKREEAKHNSIILATALKATLGLKADDVVYLCSNNVCNFTPFHGAARSESNCSEQEIAYAYGVWATLYLGAIIASGNPGFSEFVPPS